METVESQRSNFQGNKDKDDTSTRLSTQTQTQKNKQTNMATKTKTSNRNRVKKYEEKSEVQYQLDQVNSANLLFEFWSLFFLF